jgi:superfamily II DNA/RNA helicase
LSESKKEIIDNEDDTMAEFLKTALQKNGGQVSIATGYFNVEGYADLRDPLREAAKKNDFHLRLLIGNEAVVRKDAAMQCEVEAEGSLPEELDGLSINDSYASLVSDLVQFLKQEKVELRQNPERFSHAKCYIFEDRAVVGSSNFTRPGLQKNIELNAALYQPSAQKLVEQWFERRWTKGADIKQEIISVLEDSKFGRPLDPFQMYMKFLYEYYRPRLEELEQEKGKILELAGFQQDAFSSAKRILAKYGGVLIADSTGLGKTHIALELLREYVAVRRMKAMVIAPSQVLNAVWEPKLMEESIKTMNITIERTGTPSFQPEKYIDYDLLVIDESQNYRNASTNRYANLLKLIAGGKKKMVVLMTATPVNNSLLDLYHQLTLITAGDDAYFADLGIPDLRAHFLSAERKELTEGIEQIVRLLDEIMIRRTRQFIVDNYPETTINGRPVRFPKRRLRKVEYSLTALFGDQIYKKVLDTIEELHLVPYRADFYIKTLEDKARKEATLRAELQKFGLLKRFESSVEAIRTSINRLVKFYEYFEKMLASEKVLKSHAFQKALNQIGNSLDDEAAFFAEIETIELVSLTAEYDKHQMKKDIKEDLEKLNELKLDLDRIPAYADRKLQALGELLVKDRVFENDGKKCLVFTQYMDTAEYLYRNLKEQMEKQGLKISILTGKTASKEREKIIMAFAPKANKLQTGLVPETDLLISTDVLSEGQNLQDANYVVNYDLPWNPMRIVQRVGRVDRIGSEYETVTAAVFWPENALEDILGLMRRLEEKIAKISEVVGLESPILGEAENPKNFNALARIAKQDQSVLDDMERASELLPARTPYQMILTHLRKEGEKGLKGISSGKRSGKISKANGLIIFYREVKSQEGIHLLHYDFKRKRFEHYNDVSWIFQEMECNEDEMLHIPMKGFEAFRLFKEIDSKARDELISIINSPLDAKNAQKTGSKHQRELRGMILTALAAGKISQKDASDTYAILNRQNLVAWEDEFLEIHQDYRIHQDAGVLLSSLRSLFLRYKINSSRHEKKRYAKLNPKDLIVIGYEFLFPADQTAVVQETMARW